MYRYFMIANAIVSVYGVLVLFLPSESLLWRLVVALDVVIVYKAFSYIYLCFYFGLFHISTAFNVEMWF